jgi:hypothetical protein
MRRQLAMKCVSALAALTVIVLGTPAIALASTITAGSGPPAQVRIACPPPPAKHVKHVRPRLICVTRPGLGRFTVSRDGMPFVNHGPAITRTTGFMVRTPRPVR